MKNVMIGLGFVLSQSGFGSDSALSGYVLIGAVGGKAKCVSF